MSTDPKAYHGWLQRLVRPFLLSPGEKTPICQYLRIRSSPILCPLFWRRLYREVIKGRQVDCYGPLSRITSLVFLLDPFAASVWPHPRRERASDVGTILAHWILRLRNPHLEVRGIPWQEGQTSAEKDAAFEREMAWRWKMIETYGDKWPNDKLSDRKDGQSSGEKDNPGSL
jgi:hypothetical protein